MKIICGWKASWHRQPRLLDSVAKFLAPAMGFERNTEHALQPAAHPAIRMERMLERGRHSYSYHVRASCIVRNDDDIMILSARCPRRSDFDPRSPVPLPSMQPYPVHLVEDVRLAGGYAIIMRPIRPEDAANEQEFVRIVTAL